MTAFIRHLVEFLGERRTGTGAEHAGSARNLPDGGPRAGVAPELVPTGLMAAGGSVRFPPYEILPTPQDIDAPASAGGLRRRPHPSSDGASPSLLDDRIVELLEQSSLNDEADRLDETSILRRNHGR